MRVLMMEYSCWLVVTSKPNMMKYRGCMMSCCLVSWFDYAVLCFCIINFHAPLGMLSKSKGQVLRVAAVMHVLFHFESQDTESIPLEISESAVKAAGCFVDMCMQHAAYLGGRGDIRDAIKKGMLLRC